MYHLFNECEVKVPNHSLFHLLLLSIIDHYTAL